MESTSVMAPTRRWKRPRVEGVYIRIEYQYERPDSSPLLGGGPVAQFRACHSASVEDNGVRAGWREERFDGLPSGRLAAVVARISAPSADWQPGRTRSDRIPESERRLTKVATPSDSVQRVERVAGERRFSAGVMPSLTQR
jgi:hypothetical protein